MTMHPPARGAATGSLFLPLLLSAVLLATAGPAGAAESGKKFQDWGVQCETPEGADKETCFIFQNLVMKDSGQRVLQVMVGHLQNDKPAAVLTLPLGISLVQGVSVQVDDGDKKRIPVQRCQKNGCIAGLLLDDDLLAAFKGGKKAQVTFYDGRQRPVSVPVSLSGFTAGYQSLEEP